MPACQPKPPSPATTSANHDAAERYALEDRTDFELVERGLIAKFTEKLHDHEGRVIFDPAVYDFLADDAPCPDSVNPSLWRQSQLIRKGGLYRVVDGLYQVRNNDIANLTVVEGESGLVVIDCMASVEAATQGMAMIRAHVSDKPVVAVIYTHTHVDHYGGVKGVVDAADVASGKVPLIAPGTIASFDRLAIGENVIAGNAMSRRAAYAFGSLLEVDPSGHGHLTCGIGVATVPGVTVTYLSPTDSITETGSRRELAGLEFEFLYAPDTEAPEEMHIWIPQLKALTCAENANHTLHNIQTLRGARTRDARNFARYLDETLERWGDDAEVHYGPHTWPVWGNDAVTELLASQRDTYKYLHDQALRLANQGYTPLEAAEEIELPEELGRAWHNRGYHGTVHHDVRAVFTKELGMWDGDPVSLHPHPPVATAERFVELIGADRIMTEGERALETGDYRWAVQVLHLLVFADPENQAARLLQADAYEQMGYQAEGPQWRGVFLSAAKELRAGVAPVPFATASPDTILAMPIEILFDFAAVHVNGPRAAEVDVRIDFVFTDAPAEQDRFWQMWVRRGVLNARRGTNPDAQLTVTGPKGALVAALLLPVEADKLAASGEIVLAGDAAALVVYAGLLEEFDPRFDIVTP
ncbi:MBL fold metallo-hydrolase [Actinospica durhamensis]|uniref:MBL fold metallo-hydrolase n=1 Tax=Actinospica durhamensis TaxID=1508375 RepID=A0A941IPX7_9ACTN|nr:alkyl sulfatase dimerization domain-containing protein [Actinospica durhamensis]MBR7837030.1 MBL fold metallo-hydrolase [Actinospica durhamensis]